MGSYHARLSPSSADRWTTCTASAGAQDGIPNESSEASRDGTMCHQMSEEVIRDGSDPHSYLGRVMIFWTRAEDEAHGETWADDPSWDRMPMVLSHEVARIAVTEEHIDAVASATDYVLEQHRLHGGELLAEQRVPIGHFTGEEGASGTTDILILAQKTIFVKDFKYGRNRVDAYDVLMPEHDDFITGRRVPEKRRPNLQMASYALGAIEKYGLLYDWDFVSMSILQPFIQHTSEYTCTIAELMEVRDFLAMKAEETRSNPQFVPSPDACHFCRASGDCKAQTQMVFDMAIEGFDDLDNPTPTPIKDPKLGTLYSLVPMVEDWCKAVAQRVRQKLTEGEPVLRDDGLAYKLVEGRMEGRDWADPAKAEEQMDKMRLDSDIKFQKKLSSPAQLEKHAKAKRVKKGEPKPEPLIGPTQWKRLEALIAPQGRCQPAIALETDPRPAVSSTDGFDEVGTEGNPDASLNDDLF